MSEITTINYDSLHLEPTETQWLEALKGPTWIWVEGKDKSRTRVLSTLLHGNEPSGFRALHRFLQEGFKPATNVGIFIGSVQAALTTPLYTHRFLPESEDLNRAFKPPFNTPTKQLAKQFMRILEDIQPEALVDLHNTSGSSMGFAICVDDNLANEALASLFTHKLIVTDLNLGSLMEFASTLGPCVTIECGGIEDKTSDIIAYEGIKHFWRNENILSPLDGHQVHKIFNPLRLELHKDCSIGFSSSMIPEWDVTLMPDVVQYNYKTLQPNQPFGWLGVKGLAALKVLDPNSQNKIENFFTVQNHQLVAKKPLRLFMVTANPKIAKADCLFYLVAHQD